VTPPKVARNQSQIGTLVERKTLFTVLVALDNATAEHTAQRFGLVLNRFDAAMRLSMTYDNGREMAQHQALSQATGIAVYFAHPYSPWERGINENTNSLLRQAGQLAHRRLERAPHKRSKPCALVATAPDQICC
jgi:IS30 family transposase